MITLRVDADTMSRIRFSFSPAIEATTWLKTTASGHRHPVFGDPGPAARAALAHPDVALLACLVPPRGMTYMPDLLTPQPGGGTGWGELFDEQLAAIESTEGDDLAFQMTTSIPAHWGRAAPVAIQRAADSGRLQRRLAAGLQRFFREALADAWPVLNTVIDQDIADRAGSLASNGLGRTLNTAHPGIAWSGEVITLDKPCTGEIDITGRDLVLVSGVLNWPELLVQVDSPDEAVLYLPARRVGAGTRRSGSGLSAVIGDARARLLTELEDARSTTDLARKLGYAPGTVSYHLSAMHRIGLVTKNRHGRFVLYQRTAQAHALLSG
ncbi:helix-turn-helix domain-containing protein [Saccharothrix sp. AJ9571]|nr:helix-turn-helix domain-containing protein [Saccharothrix sp. AJ9571]